MEERRLEDRREDRRDEILRALVEEHIRSGEPVSSRAILDATGLQVSGATIRNELVSLDREGYAVQPHTSAGRVPTAKAYRYYVDHLSHPRLRAAAQHRIASFFGSVHLELGKLLKATTELLTDLTSYPAIAVSPGPVGEQVKALHLVQMGAKTALVVLVTQSGRVCQELCKLTEPVTTVELEEAEQIMAATFTGKDLGSVKLDVPVARELSAAVRHVLGTAADAVSRATAQSADVYVGGTRQMATVWDNLATVHRVLEVLEREATLLQILAEAPGVSIRIGDELPVKEGVDMAVVSTSFDSGSTEGRVGVIGPMRMDYRKVISTVEGVSRELTERIGS